MSTQVSDRNAIRRKVFAQPAFRRYYLGYAASMCGTAMAGTATSFAFLDTGRGASGLGLVMACGIAPLLLCLPLAGVLADRSRFWKDLSMPFYGYNRPGAKISEGVRESFWWQGMRCGMPGSYFCIKAFSETDLTEDLKKIDVPTLILHGDDDQIVPIADSALLSAKIVKDAKLKVVKGAPHGMCSTLKDMVNEELLGFIAG